jgi:hypothetical protein
VIVGPLIGLLNVAASFWLSGTLVAAPAGFVEVTAGWDPTMKVHTKLDANAAPVGSFAPVVIVAVNRVLAGSAVAGVNVAVLPEYVTAPATGVVVGPVKVNVVPVIVVGSIAALKVAETIVFTATPVAAFAGIVETTDGGGAVVKVQT